ncbi:DNA-directed DNA polymerase [Tanacetum coccineum]|uniref:DNA-directed DNA polymerase n=1 Tax=Tanacetum coccineum TaxID=301880 RepID=A0ABQ5EWC5_9ASTR
MTRSTVKRLTEPLDEPEREFRRLRRAALRSHQKDSLAIARRNHFDDKASSSNNIGLKLPTPPKTLHEHSHPTSSGFQNPITFPTEQTRRIIDSRDIWLIQNTRTFQGLRTEDPLRHVKHYLGIIDNIQADRATRDTYRFRSFHFSLKGKATEWLNRIPPTQVTTWDQLVSRFLDHFFPIGRTSALRDLILRFKQGDDETIKSAWIRFQDLINQVPHHGIQKWLLVCLSGGDIYNDPSLIRFYQNDDTSPWGNKRHKEKGEDGPEWTARSKFEDELTNFMLEKKLKKQKKDDKDERLLSIFKQIHINLPFLEAMIYMPKGAKVLKDLLSHKEKLEKAASSVKLILEIDEDELVPISLGRPFLATARAVIDVHEGKLSLRVRNETITFNIGKSMKSKHSRDDYLYCANHTAKLVQEQWVNTVNHDRKWTEEEEEGDSNSALAVSFHPRTEPVEPLEWKTPDNRLKASSIESPKLELKELPEHLEYTFLQENNQLPVIISSALSIDEKTGLLEVLQNHKGLIAWSIADIKGIDSSFCTHKILMEDEFKPSVQPQRRVNHNIKEVVKKEVIKFLMPD